MAEATNAMPDLEALADRPLALRKSSRLKVVPCRLRGETHYGIERSYQNEDERSQFFRLTEKQHFVLSALDGKTCLAEIKRRYEIAFGEEIELEHIHSLVSGLRANGLAETSLPGRGAELFRKRQERTSWFSKAFRNPFSIVIPVIDPDRILDGLKKNIGWIFSGPAVAFSLFLILAAALSLFTNFDKVHQRLPEFHEFFGPKNWLYLAAAIIITKVLHEFGHGLAAKRYGYKVNEMGVMFLVGMPVFYCDVTQSHLEPDKWKRMKIASAGVYVELFIAAIATFIWLNTSTGLLNHLCLAIMFTASVNTLIFNLNPLMRFDGHYVLAYYWERPELRKQSSEYLRAKLGWLLVGRDSWTPYDRDSDSVWLGVYSVLSAAYRWWIIYKILMFLHAVGEPYGLGGLIACVACYKLILQPVWAFVLFLSPALQRWYTRHFGPSRAEEALAI